MQNLWPASANIISSSTGTTLVQELVDMCYTSYPLVGLHSLPLHEPELLLLLREAFP